MVLDAAPQWEPGEDHGRHGQEPPRCDGPGDAEASDHLAVFADELQTRGEPLGEWMALWLAGKDEETGEAVTWLRARTPVDLVAERASAARKAIDRELNQRMLYGDLSPSWPGGPDDFGGSDFP